ncbi:zinc-dependent alcohol dehydrogenase [Streptomyces sp. NBC_01423]|uniref:zinc-dependent alcohol dehydrogenase n=1 Tax=Streptomyces sp. NBC_01423 TaxID=2903860 RepID=UPI002E2B8F3A|nr:zinc-binding dehydrogenase [Streptomyces sp. NBC_01423]
MADRSGQMDVVGITGPRRAGTVRKPMPRIDRDYVLIRVLAAPMCNEYVAYTDGVYLERNKPDSLGHEMAGEVVRAPAGAPVREGDRVVAFCGYPCGRCETCRRGFYAHCAATEDPRGVCGAESGECGFAQYAVKPAWMCETIPDGMSYEHAAMACCGLGPTFGAMERLGVGPGSTVLITGLGAVGLGGVINAKARGATVIAAVRTPYRAELARELGADHVVEPSHKEVLTATGGLGADHVIECSGQEVYQRLALDAVARLGTVAFLAEPGSLVLSIDEDLIQRGVTLLGTLDINRNDARRLLRLIASVPDQLDRYITHRLPLDRAAEAFEAQASFETGKIVLFPHGTEEAR